MSRITCFGEVLWDVFPDHKKIGGAPLNVALRLQSFGNNVYMISRIGEDQEGSELLEYLKERKLDISSIQKDSINQTGAVKVTLDKSGSATYEIVYPIAWDKIEITQHIIEKVKLSSAFIFGSLACRDKVSRKTLLNLLEHASFKVFDVNLRKPFFSMDLLTELMNKADFMKCNDEELNEICSSMGFNSKSMNEQIAFLSKETNTNQICVTKGKEGAILFFDKEFYDNSGYSVRVEDTVGAGDSFLASLIDNILNGTKPDEALDFASAVGALVASKEGANPKLSYSEISNFIKNS